jgi:hypothetical protein
MIWMEMDVQEAGRLIKLFNPDLLVKEEDKGHPWSLFAKEVEKGLLRGLLSFRFSFLRPKQVHVCLEDFFFFLIFNF